MTDIPQLKQSLRRQARAYRQAQPDKDRLSHAICKAFAGLSEYENAATVLVYVDIRHEVRTREFITHQLAGPRRIAVPYCVGDRLELFLTQSLDELRPGAFGIPEPDEALRSLPARTIDIREVDLVMVPGVAFDRLGTRLGHGKGHYDRLLAGARADCVRVGVAFECQLLEHIPSAPHDVRMDKIVTERGVIDVQRE